MAIKIWTSAESAVVGKVFGQALKSFRPDVPAHQFFTLNPDYIPEPGPEDVTLVCGNAVLDVLRIAGIIPKNRTANSMREKPVKRPSGGYFLVTFDPGLTQKEFHTREIIEWDVRLAARLMRTGTTEPSVGDYQWVADLQEVVDYVEDKFAKTGKSVDVSMDTETMGLWPWYPDRDIISISFTAKPRTSRLLYLGTKRTHPLELDKTGKLIAHIKFLLNSPKVKLRGANLKFDLLWIIEKWGIECTNFKFDTLLVGTLLNENRSNSLNLHAKIFTDMGGYDDRFNATVDKGHMELVHPTDLLTYAGGDTDACQQVADQMREELAEDAALTKFYVTILHPAARAFEKIERRGVLIDVPKSKALAAELRVVIKKSQGEALSLLPPNMVTKYRDRIGEQIADGKNPLLPSILKEYFFSPSGLNLKPKMRSEVTKEPSMAKAHLKQFFDVPEAKMMVETLTTMDVAAKTLSTFVEGFLEHLRPDGRLHPTYMLFHGGLNDDADDESGTVTGRLSCKNPAFQTLPKKTKWAKKIRECYPAPPGKVIILIDYSQGELKVVACVANEKTMLSAYKNKLDLHALTGAKLSGNPIEVFMTWKDNPDEKLAALFEKFRGSAKPMNFGLLYGMQVEGFVAYAWIQYGLKLTLEEGAQMRDAFFELYPGLLDYHSHQKDLVHMHEGVRSPLGRIRHLPYIRSWDREIRALAQRQAINAPIQSTLTDMMIWAIALIDHAYPGGEIEVVGMIHDAIICYVPEDAYVMWAKRASDIMSNLPLHEVGWHPELQFTVDVEAGPNLAKLGKVKFS